VLGDIIVQDVDAIVTAANESLLGGGGVEGAIHRAAGPRLAEAGAAIGRCEPGDAMATPAFDLDPPVRHVIHTVGPVWEGDSHGEDDILASCYRRSLQVADELTARSVAFPAIATGVYGFPPERAAKIAVEPSGQPRLQSSAYGWSPLTSRRARFLQPRSTGNSRCPLVVRGRDDDLPLNAAG